ncbi:efflux RND transporter periplasmic adaptor subunit [Pseudidiomarina salilacus]|uniref:efflux RND transporter periplasmic adaptor subunit n=1 Tax=Pseudidiomarina salilacus TaxID=3384452 RepID=UPI00398469C5
MIDFKAHKQAIALILVMVPLLFLLGYVVMNSGPLAPVKVVTTKVQEQSLKPALFGIGTVEARYTYTLGYAYPARIKTLFADVGDEVEQGSVLVKLEPIDLEQRIAAKAAALQAAGASITEAEAKLNYADAQAERYAALYATNAVSADDLAAKQQALAVARATLVRVKDELDRNEADYQALLVQRQELDLVAPANGVVIARNAEVGSTVPSGQTILELIDPASIWVNVRFDQISATGLRKGLPATVTLRSQQHLALQARVERVELKADAITEETLAKVVFTQIPDPLPRIGELTEVNVSLAELAPTLVIPNAAIHRLNGELGVWRVQQDDLHFAPIVLGRSDLDGNVQVLEGLQKGDAIVLFSEREISARSSIQQVKTLVESVE